MDKTALRHAWEALHAAHVARDALASSETFGEVETAWEDFLMAAGKIYAKLEKGAKASGGQCEPWFGTIKHERRRDELLSYLHHARYAAEHGIEDISKRDPGGWQLRGDVHVDKLTTDEDGNIDYARIRSVNSSKPARLRLIAAHVALVPVKDDRYPKDIFHPPKEHLGVKLTTGSPLEVATLGLEYLERIVRAGSAFAK